MLGQSVQEAEMEQIRAASPVGAHSLLPAVAGLPRPLPGNEGGEVWTCGVTLGVHHAHSISGGGAPLLHQNMALVMDFCSWPPRCTK